jgi:hypothetical protein
MVKENQSPPAGKNQAKQKEIVGSYKMGAVLGRGSYATVRVAKGWKGGVFAVKVYEKSRADPDQLANIQSEISIMSQISH